jgi:Domain of Unknown Function (DUF1080)
MQKILCWTVALWSFGLLGAEKTFEFSELSEGKIPPGFRSSLTGKGNLGDWQIILDEEAPLMPLISPQAKTVTKHPVLAQLSRQRIDDHYPLMIYDGETYADFKLTARFKLVDGTDEQMAGLAFRIQDEKNYYYVRASALGKSFYFFKFVDGELIGPIGSKVEILKGVWQEMSVECRGSQITCALNGREVIPQMHQDTFAKGKIGFWTKSDSVSYFADARITYKPMEVPAQAIVRDVLKKYPRLLALKVYGRGTEPGSTQILASNLVAENGQPGSKTEREVIANAETWYGKEKDSVSVIMPLHDRNGEPIAAVRVVMKTFKGQTEENAIIRATPIVKEIQSRVSSMDDLVD